MVNESSSVLWTPGRFRLFLSHISAEKAYVAAVKAELAEHEVDGFVAHEDIEPTRDWQDTIELALHECQALVALLHPRFHESLWTDQEVGFARSLGVLVIPVRLGLDPYGFIGRYQGLPGAESPVELARSIVDVLISHELTSPAMGQSVVRALETAPSYAAARVRVAHAGNYAHWTPELLSRLRAAPELNRQVRESTGVPAAIDAIVAAHSGGIANEVPPTTSAAAEAPVHDEWWREAGAPSFRLSQGSTRGDPPWQFNATIIQEGGDSLPMIHVGWLGPSIPERLRPSDLEPRREGEWRLPDLQFDPLDAVAAEPLSIEAEFTFRGQSRTQRWHRARGCPERRGSLRWRSPA